MDRDFTIDDLIPELKRNGVDGTVLEQSLNNLDETHEYLALQRKFDFIRGVVGWTSLVNPDEAIRSLEDLRKRGKLVGIRHLISFEPDPDWLLQPGVMESLRWMAKEKLVFDAVPMNFRQMETVFKVAEQIPDLKIALNHLARPPVVDGGWEPWATMVTRAAAYPNVSLKFSPGLDLVTRWHWKTEMVTRYAEHLFKSFGANRVMAASNWPVSLMGGTYTEIWSGITELASMLSPAERAQVLGGTAERIYGL